MLLLEIFLKLKAVWNIYETREDGAAVCSYNIICMIDFPGARVERFISIQVVLLPHNLLGAKCGISRAIKE